jgi:hypothetical protein
MKDIMIYFVDNCGQRQINYPESLARAKSKIMGLQKTVEHLSTEVQELRDEAGRGTDRPPAD